MLQKHKKDKNYLRKLTPIIINLLIICIALSGLFIYLVYFAKPEIKEVFNQFINNKRKNIQTSLTKIGYAIKNNTQRKKSQKNQKIANLYSSIEKNIIKQDYLYSLDLIQVLKKELKNPNIILAEAQILVKLNENTKAISVIKNGIKKYKKYIKFYQVLASIYLLNDQYQSVIDLLKNLKAKQHTGKTILYLLISHINMKNYQKAYYYIEKYKNKIDNISTRIIKSLFSYYMAMYFFILI